MAKSRGCGTVSNSDVDAIRTQILELNKSPMDGAESEKILRELEAKALELYSSHPVVSLKDLYDAIRSAIRKESGVRIHL